MSQYPVTEKENINSRSDLEVNVKDFFEKGGEKIKMEPQKPYKCRLRDSERLSKRKGEYSYET